MSTRTFIGAFLVVLLLGGGASAQNLLNGPESVVYDTLNNRYIVSSLLASKIVAIDDYGIQSDMFTSLGYTFGNCIKDNILYVSTGGSPSVIRGYDLATDTEVMNVTIPASVQCDGVTTDTSGNLYIMDARNESLIWKIDLTTETYSVYENMHLDNGSQDIFFDAEDNRLLAISYAGNTPIKAISIPDADVTDVVASYGGYDGITMDDRGYTYVAQSTGGVVYRYDSEFNDPPDLISSGHDEPSGLDYNVHDNILAVPNFSGDRVDFVQMRIAAESDVSVGWAPLEVNFDGSADETVTSWSWDFGDGGTSTEQSPTHTYDEPGFFDVTLEAVTTSRETLVRVRKGMIGSLADTLSAGITETGPGETAEVLISLRNSVPLRSITIPVEYSGDLDITLDSFSTAGCRTDYFETVNIIHSDSWGKRTTYRLIKDPVWGSPPLAPGAGPVLKLYFSVPAGDQWELSSPVIVDGYSSYTPGVTGPIFDYDVPAVNGSVIVPDCCLNRGNVDDETGPGGPVDVSDLTYLVAYLFNSGPVPPCPSQGNVDGLSGPGGDIDVSDLTFIVAYLFNSGATPPPCS